MSKFARNSAVYAFTGATDLSAKRGYLVTLAASIATLSASATVPAKGVILDGEATTGKSSIGILGAGLDPVMMMTNGVITKGAFVAQHTDGTVKTDPGTGARVVVGIAMEDAAGGDLIEVAPLMPIVLA